MSSLIHRECVHGEFNQMSVTSKQRHHATQALLTNETQKEGLDVAAKKSGEEVWRTIMFSRKNQKARLFHGLTAADRL